MIKFSVVKNLVRSELAEMLILREISWREEILELNEEFKNIDSVDDLINLLDSRGFDYESAVDFIFSCIVEVEDMSIDDESHYTKNI